MSTEAQKGMGRGVGRGRMRGRVFGSRMPILIPHRNPASAHYYEHKDVSESRVFRIVETSDVTCQVVHRVPRS